MDSGEFEKGDRIDVRLNEQESPANGWKQSTVSIQDEPTTPSIAPSEPRRKDASSTQILNFLLSDAALEWCRPEEENKDVQRNNNLITYSQFLSPFEELLCAVVMSRSIPYRLGLRTIRTILNPPYEFRQPVAIKMAGSAKIQQALWSARMKHKGRTAEEIDVIAAAMADNQWHNDIQKIRKQARGVTGQEREALQSTVKGMGQDGLDIFYRRIQCQWPEVYPYIDPRAQAALERLGLPTRAEGIQKMIEDRWAEFEIQEEGQGEKEERKRRAFVILLERAVGAVEEHNTEEVVEEASHL
ncbi:hypothetical protein P153DRAFT_319037 [Dothidotthia symphoricarpi CBS 119687]|uniref:Uncharacterized protein n=1 Tax=Dothidotthia symphoricarpi CBS 119687 TaxID=1392245 RepID=A0A6A6A9T1_9PLEO|nr:uncharacterized protein P153DRAFT_319037 [Dothidotthia symphoricarpi CBS 119687]KAF2127935.1 hypothetical protein P153DRAFT_319037 [Dothidotthia symphoricarpi CBS 119687]